MNTIHKKQTAIAVAFAVIISTVGAFSGAVDAANYDKEVYYKCKGEIYRDRLRKTANAYSNYTQTVAELKSIRGDLSTKAYYDYTQMVVELQLIRGDKSGLAYLEEDLDDIKDLLEEAKDEYNDAKKEAYEEYKDASKNMKSEYSDAKKAAYEEYKDKSSDFKNEYNDAKKECKDLATEAEE